MPGKYKVEQQVEFDGLEMFGGVRAHGVPGIHAVLVKSIERIVPSGSAVLDLACGAGALTLRLKAAGYSMTACDLIPDKPQFGGEIPLIAADLNQDFARLFPEKYSCVVASEIIEHLENPRHFLREIHKLLEPGGFVVVTTPNIDSPVSRAMALRTGYDRWFAPNDWEESGHITPMSRISLERAMRECGFQVTEYRSLGGGHRVPDWRSVNVLAALLKPLCDPLLREQVLMMCGRA